MEKPKLITSTGGNSAYIKFPKSIKLPKGKKSAHFNNEEEIVSFIRDSLNKNEMTEDEAGDIFDQMVSLFEKKKLFKSHYHSPAGLHRHKCKKCSYIWEHDGSFLCSHNCPNCGKSEYVKYFGIEPPTNSAMKK